MDRLSPILSPIIRDTSIIINGIWRHNRVQDRKEKEEVQANGIYRFFTLFIDMCILNMWICVSKRIDISASTVICYVRVVLLIL